MPTGRRLTAQEHLRHVVLSYMQARYGKRNVTRFCADSKISVGTIGRLLEGNTSVGIAIVEELADFFGVTLEELFADGFSPGGGKKPSEARIDALSPDTVRAVHQMSDGERRKLENMMRAYMELPPLPASSESAAAA